MSERECDRARVSYERDRLLAEYERRDGSITRDKYDAISPTVVLERTGRVRLAAAMLRDAGVRLTASTQCLEVGCGELGWMADLIVWGARPPNVYGIDLSATRIQRARKTLPDVNFRVGDATDLPWDAGSFDIVIASTVFTSILDNDVRRLAAAEIVRVLEPRGALLWYDFALNNPRNPQVRGVTRAELRALFPHLKGDVRSLTLAPPLSRFVAPRSIRLASWLGKIPILQTHLLAVLHK